MICIVQYSKADHHLNSKVIHIPLDRDPDIDFYGCVDYVLSTLRLMYIRDLEYISVKLEP